jgi:hypothetical protein
MPPPQSAPPSRTFVNAQHAKYTRAAPSPAPSAASRCRPSFDEFQWEGIGFADRVQLKLLLLFDWYVGYARIQASGWWLFVLPVPSFWIGIIYLVLRRSQLRKHNLFQPGGKRTPAAPPAPSVACGLCRRRPCPSHPPGQPARGGAGSRALLRHCAFRSSAASFAGGNPARAPAAQPRPVNPASYRRNSSPHYTARRLAARSARGPA